MVENPIEATNTGKEASKTIIGDNTKATMGNITPPVQAITIIIKEITDTVNDVCLPFAMFMRLTQVTGCGSDISDYMGLVL